MKVRWLTGLAAGMATAVVLGFTPGASADVGVLATVKQGKDYASSNGTWVEACDMEEDGHGVYGRFDIGAGAHAIVRDPNGSAGGCGNQTFGRVYRLQVCEDLNNLPDPCSDWAWL